MTDQPATPTPELVDLPEAEERREAVEEPAKVMRIGSIDRKSVV